METRLMITNLNSNACVSTFVTDDGKINLPASVKSQRDQGQFIKHLIVICYLFVPAMRKHLASWFIQAWNCYMNQDECCCGDLHYFGHLAYGLGFQEIGDRIRFNSRCKRGPAILNDGGSFDPWAYYISRTHECKRRVGGEPVLASDEVAIVSGKTTEGAAPGEWVTVYSVYSNANLKPLITPDCLDHIWASKALLPLAGMTEVEKTTLATEVSNNPA